LRQLAPIAFGKGVFRVSTSDPQPLFFGNTYFFLNYQKASYF
jgi:hypothetical protein